MVTRVAVLTLGLVAGASAGCVQPRIDSPVAYERRQALYDLSPRALVQAAETGLTDGDWRIAATLCEIAVEEQVAGVVPAAATLLARGTYSDQRVEYLLWAVGRLGGAEHTPLIARHLGHRRSVVRGTAETLLGATATAAWRRRLRLPTRFPPDPPLPGAPIATGSRRDRPVIPVGCRPIVKVQASPDGETPPPASQPGAATPPPKEDPFVGPPEPFVGPPEPFVGPPHRKPSPRTSNPVTLPRLP